MATAHQPPRIGPSRRAAIFLFVALLHLLLLYWMALMRPAAPSAVDVLPPPLQVWLFPSGGGARAGDPAISPATRAKPSAASSLHVPPDPAPWPDTPVATPEAEGAVPAPGLDPEPVAPSTATVAALEAAGAAAGGSGDAGASGAGSGAGAGIGAGRGSGIGRGWGAVLIRGPGGATISRNVSPEALAALPASYAVLRCRIRLDQRLDDCRVLRESPPGQGVGQAALVRAAEFRFRPPRVGSRFRDRRPITVAIAFPPDAEPAPAPEAR